MDDTLEINDELIGKYVNGDLNEVDQKRFVKELNANKSLKNEVHVHAILIAENNSDIKSFFNGIITESGLKPQEFDLDEEVLAFIDSNPLVNSEVNSISKNTPEKNTEIKPDSSSKLDIEEEAIIKPESLPKIDPKKKPVINSDTNIDIKPKFGLFKIAAAFLIFCLLGSVLYFSLGTSSQNANQLADKFIARHYSAPTILRSESQAQVDADWQSAVKFYKSNDFSSSLKYTGIVTNRVSDNAEYNFYHGLNNLYSSDGNIEDAVNAFDKVPNSSNLFEVASWHKALAYLKINKKNKAKAIFEKIASNSQSSRSADSAKFLKSLNGN